MAKTIERIKRADPAMQFMRKTDMSNWKAITAATGLTTPEKVKQDQRAAAAQAEASAAAAKLAAENLQKNQLVDLADANNTPDVVAGGTAQDLALGGDMKRKRAPSLSTQLGVRV